jgi:hypothetical protein
MVLGKNESVAELARAALGSVMKHVCLLLAILCGSCATVGVKTDRAAATSKAPVGGECRTGNDGVEACGFHCEMGTDNKMRCAKQPDGRCLMGTNGRVACGMECKMSGDGVAVCKE